VFEKLHDEENMTIQCSKNLDLWKFLLDVHCG